MTLPTPHKVPATPVHLGPPSDATKSLTSVTKRNVHNLSKMVPHANAQIPPLALTDTEVIVFFFNALARPIVSLRLYANEWGPKSICQVLNGHRYIEPHYLRNTCSVKCTTAIKNGREKFGPEWEEKNRTLLARTDTTKATDMIRLADDDADVRYVDWDLREFCNGLTKFPTVGEQGGLFTQCVQYCFENDYACTLSNILEFSKKLEAGQLPPGRPVPNSLSPMPLNGLAADELQGLDADAMFEDTMFQDEMVQDPINGSQNSMFSMFHQLDDTDDVGFRH